MSRWNDPAITDVRDSNRKAFSKSPGATRRALGEIKRAEAEGRNRQAPPERRRQNRLAAERTAASETIAAREARLARDARRQAMITRLGAK